MTDFRLTTTYIFILFELPLYILNPQGLVDPQKEIAKLDKKKEFLNQTINKLQQAIAAEDYTTKVPVEVQKTNTEKLAQSLGEMERLLKAVETLKLM